MEVSLRVKEAAESSSEKTCLSISLTACGGCRRGIKEAVIPWGLRVGVRVVAQVGQKKELWEEEEWKKEVKMKFFQIDPSSLTRAHDLARAKHWSHKIIVTFTQK